MALEVRPVHPRSHPVLGWLHLYRCMPKEGVSMSIQDSTLIAGVIALAVVPALVLARNRLGSLNTASWLVILGALVIVSEHGQFALFFTLAPGPMHLLPHARLHFFMAGIYTIIGAVLLVVIARTLLKEGRRSGWYALLFALLVGAGFDLVMQGWWFQHGSPLYQWFGGESQGFGWEFLYTYPVAWIAALVISYKPIFRNAKAQAARSLP